MTAEEVDGAEVNWGCEFTAEQVNSADFGVSAKRAETSKPWAVWRTSGRGWELAKTFRRRWWARLYARWWEGAGYFSYEVRPSEGWHGDR